MSSPCGLWKTAFDEKDSNLDKICVLNTFSTK